VAGVAKHVGDPRTSMLDGETFAPSVIEQVLLEHAGVVEAAAVGRPGGRQGDHVIAYVVPRARAGGASLVEELTRFCRAALPR